MICFRSLQNWYLQQLTKAMLRNDTRCDLLSFFAKLIFTTTHLTVVKNEASCDLLSFFAKLIFTTTISVYIKITDVLWFAFVLCKTDIYNNLFLFRSWINWVVICFRSLQNWYLQQQSFNWKLPSGSCDLLSFFAKLIFTTTHLTVVKNEASCDLLSFFAKLIFTTTLSKLKD